MGTCKWPGFLSLARSYSFVSNLFSNITITKKGKPFKNNNYNWSLTPLLCTALDQRANSLEKKTVDVLLVVASLAKKWLEFVCVSRLSENWQKQNYLYLSFYWCWLKGWSKLVVFRYNSKHWLWVCRYELPSSWYWKSLLWICR